MRNEATFPKPLDRESKRYRGVEVLLERILVKMSCEFVSGGGGMYLRGFQQGPSLLRLNKSSILTISLLRKEVLRVRIHSRPRILVVFRTKALRFKGLKPIWGTGLPTNAGDTSRLLSTSTSNDICIVSHKYSKQVEVQNSSCV